MNDTYRATVPVRMHICSNETKKFVSDTHIPSLDDINHDTISRELSRRNISVRYAGKGMCGNSLLYNGDITIEIANMRTATGKPENWSYQQGIFVRIKGTDDQLRKVKSFFEQSYNTIQM
jgi:hypothetical protein